MKYKVQKLDDRHIPQLEVFCKRAGEAGYKNNSSLESLKFGKQYDLLEPPDYWGIFKEDEIISICGAHLWDDEISEGKSFRVLFRGAALPEYLNVIPILSKTHMNSLQFAVMMPHSIKLGLEKGCKNFYITTSHGPHNASGRQDKVHKIFQLLAKQDIIKFHKVARLFYVPQTIWKLDLGVYYQLLRNFHNTRMELFDGLDDEYMEIYNNGFNIVSE